MTWNRLTAGISCGETDLSQVIALTEDGTSRTIGDLRDRIDAWQIIFQQSDITWWAIYIQDPFEFLCALYGAWHSGKTAVIPGDDREPMLQQLSNDGCGLAGDLPNAVTAPRNSIAPKVQRTPLDPKESKLVLYTSGSEGNPKAIAKHLFQLINEVTALSTAFSETVAHSRATISQPLFISTVSHQHIYGLLFRVLWPLSIGCTFSCRRFSYPDEFISHLGCTPTVLITTPAHLRRLPNHLNKKVSNNGLQAVFSSGGPLPFKTAVDVQKRLGQTVIEVLGSTETGGVAWRKCEFADSPWKPLPGARWKVQSECLHVKSPWMANDTWYATSDRVERLIGDQFRLIGRSDRIVKIEEKRISLLAIEKALIASDFIDETRVLVVDTPTGKRIGAVLVLSSLGLNKYKCEKNAFVQHLRRSLRPKLEPIAIPRRWRVVDCMPINAQGKTTNQLLESLFIGKHQQPMPPVIWDCCEEDRSVALLDIKDDLVVLDGHFDAAAVVPGVAQLDWAIALGMEYFNISTNFVRLESIKFVRPVLPGIQLRMELTLKPHPSDHALKCLSFTAYSLDRTTGDRQPHSSGRVIWACRSGDRNV